MADKTVAEEVVFYLDSSAITNGASLPPARCRTTPSVVDEFKPGGATHRRLEFYLSGGMTVAAPRDEALQRVELAVRGAGSGSRLSRTDRDILALCLDDGARGELVTDDYTIQDVARRLGVRVHSVATRGIEVTKDWVARCAGCGRNHPASHAGQACPVCGSEVRLKPAKRE